MALERFADIVERFANGDQNPVAGVSPDTVRRWQEEMERQHRRTRNLSVDNALQALNLASRTQLTAVAKQIVELEEM